MAGGVRQVDGRCMQNARKSNIWEQASYMEISSSPDVQSLDEVTIPPPRYILARQLPRDTHDPLCFSLVQLKTSFARYSLDSLLLIANTKRAHAVE
jgi:hypothetical protein